MEWKLKRHGHCGVCRVYGRVIFHHLVDEQTVRKNTTAAEQAAGIVWDQRNAFSIGAPTVWGGRCRCHSEHHVWALRDTRIQFEKVPQPAREYAIEVLGEGPAEAYWERHYRGAP